MIRAFLKKVQLEETSESATRELAPEAGSDIGAEAGSDGGGDSAGGELSAAGDGTTMEGGTALIEYTKDHKLCTQSVST